MVPKDLEGWVFWSAGTASLTYNLSFFRKYLTIQTGTGVASMLLGLWFAIAEGWGGTLVIDFTCPVPTASHGHLTLSICNWHLLAIPTWSTWNGSLDLLLKTGAGAGKRREKKWVSEGEKIAIISLNSVFELLREKWQVTGYHPWELVPTDESLFSQPVEDEFSVCSTAKRH